VALILREGCSFKIIRAPAKNRKFSLNISSIENLKNIINYLKHPLALKLKLIIHCLLLKLRLTQKRCLTNQYLLHQHLSPKKNDWDDDEKNRVQKIKDIFRKKNEDCVNVILF